MSNKNIYQKFVSIDDAHSFEISISDESLDLAYFTIINITPEHYKTFLLLLKDGFDFMIKNNILIVKQIINSTDIEFFKKSTISYYDNYVIISTNIEYFLEEICNGLGIQRL